MQLTGGTPKALLLIQELKESGNLIDIYDRERIKATKNSSIVTLDMMDTFDKKYGTDYHHHLLAIFVDDNVDANNLIDVYPDFEEKFNNRVYKPKLIFINLASRQISADTITRKGNVISDFVPHPIGIKGADDFDRMSFVDKYANERIELFEKLDYAGVMSQLLSALQQISNADYNLVYREIDSGHIQEMLAAGPNKHGLYVKDSWGTEDEDDEDVEGITEEELHYAIEEIEDLESDLSYGVKVIADFFPNRSIDYDNFCSDE
jgi:hypothetical protein